MRGLAWRQTLKKRPIVFVVSVGWCLVLFSCADPEPEPEQSTCDALALIEALSEASSGDTVEVGACRITASLTVPAGVTLLGQGQAVTTIVAPAGETAITLTPGTTATQLRQLSVEADATGIIARGSGAASVTDVTVRSTGDIAMGVEALTDFSLSSVHLVGPLDVGAPVTIDMAETHGLVVVDVASADLDNVNVSGFTEFGAILVESTTVWTTGSLSDNVSTGLLVHGGSLTLSHVDISATRQGYGLTPPYGAVFSADADVTTTDLQVIGGEGVGLLHDATTAQHVDLVITDNDDAGVWIQQSNGVSVSGSNSLLSDNRLAAIVVVDSSNITFSDATIETTGLVSRVSGTSTVEVGDGIELVRATDSITLQNLTLSNNERIGLLVELGSGSMTGIEITDVTIEGTGSQLGAVAQGGTVADGWDSGISRDSDVAANDDAFTGTLDVVGLVGPNDLPAPNVTEDGLDALVGPND